MNEPREGDPGRDNKRKNMGSLRELRTAIKASIRSKPKVEGQEYLDMYVLTRDRARWERMERQSVETLSEIEKHLRKFEKTLPEIEYIKTKEGKSSGPAQRGPKPIRPMKTMPLEY